MTEENNTEEIIEKYEPKRHTKTGFYYSFLTVVLLLCLIQIGFGAILNISKTIAYRAKISTLTKIRDNAENRKQDLKEDIKLFSATSTLEGIARNNLKMAGEDEILILINQPQNTEHKKQKKNNKKKKKK